MDTNINEPVVNDAEVSDAELESASKSNDEGNEAEVAKEPKEEEFDALKDEDKKPEPTKEDAIPYSRFAEVNAERKSYQKMLEAKEAELAKYKAQEAKLAEVKTPDDIKMSDYETLDAYLKARDDARDNILTNKLKAETIKQQEEEAKAAYEKTLYDNYTSILDTNAKENPEVPKAVNHFDKLADDGKIDSNVAFALMQDPNCGLIMHKICKNKEYYNTLLNDNPVNIIKMIGRISDRIDSSKNIKKSDNEDNAELPDLDDNTSTNSPSLGVPSTIRSTSSGQKDVSKMSLAEYRKWKASRK